jgi:ATP adenylyltransferase/5',5'''-P-1,P-4-tetraphosphate phosphorylase II
VTNLSQQIDELYRQQSQNWPAFAEALKILQQVESKHLEVKDDQISVQFNPARIRSTAASIDPKVIAKRSCFLCTDNRPVLQQGVLALDSRYSFLVNPFPILSEHLTIVGNVHCPQSLEDSFEDMLRIVAELDERWALLFNGAKAGASAPDHMHFQALPKNLLPIYEKFQKLNEKAEVTDCNIFSFASASMILLSSENSSEIYTKTLSLIEKLEDSQLLNVLSWREGPKFYCILMPRTKHRPGCYYTEAKTQFLVSPATIELSGVWVLPREQDFQVVSAEKIAEIVKEVSFGQKQIEELLKAC